MEPAVPDRHSDLATRKKERRRKVQSIQTPKLVGERKFARLFHKLLIDLDNAERRPLGSERP